MIGYACRSRGSDSITIGTGRKMPELNKETGWFWHVPGCFATMGVRTFKKKFGFIIEPGTVVKIKIGVTLNER